jgi:hypothetical protein
MKKIFFLLAVFFLVVSYKMVGQDFDVMELTYPEELEIIKRADWGWLPLEKAKEEAEIKKITIHHGGVEFTKGKDPVELMKTLQKWSRAEKNWIDMPYNFMIDLDGNIYEALPVNYPGDTNIEYDPTGHVSIEVMGNYEVQEFSENQLNAVVSLSAYLAKEFDVSLSDIKTHKDYSEMTVCPGKNIYKYFEDSFFIKMVKESLDN